MIGHVMACLKQEFYKHYDVSNVTLVDKQLSFVKIGIQGTMPMGDTGYIARSVSYLGIS